MEPKWKYVASIYLKKKHALIFRDNGLAIQLQVISRTSSRSGATRRLYFVDGNRTAFSTEADLLHAIEAGTLPQTPGLHPLFIECVPGHSAEGSTFSKAGPKFPSFFEQSARWALGVAHRVGVAVHEVLHPSHLPSHPLSR
jgi:hypothetical protein